MCVSVVAMLDRQILSLMVDPIRQSLTLSDLQIGVLQGPAFMIFYTLFGFPVGWMVDRTHRLRLIAGGVTIWTVGTIGCGLATSYESMIVARAIVGMGEAVAGPGSISLLADFFRPERRPMVMSVHGTASMLGTGLALVGGGLLLSLSAIVGPISIPGLPVVDGWRFAFVACAFPGFLVALLALTAKEPARQHEGNQSGGKPKLGHFVSMASGWIVTHFSAVCLIAIMSYAFMSWLPTYLIRGYGWDAANVGLLTGLQFLVLGPAGILMGGYLVRRLQRKGLPDAPTRVLRMGAIMLAGSLGALALPWPAGAILVPLSVSVFCVSMLPITSILAIQQATPNELRGRLSAIYFISTNLVGYSAGPILTAALTEFVFGQAEQIGYSLALVGIGLGPLAAILFSLSLPKFRSLVLVPEQEGLPEPALAPS
jgi:MFS family permease